MARTNKSYSKQLQSQLASLDTDQALSDLSSLSSQISREADELFKQGSKLTAGILSMEKTLVDAMAQSTKKGGELSNIRLTMLRSQKDAYSEMLRLARENNSVELKHLDTTKYKYSLLTEIKNELENISNSYRDQGFSEAGIVALMVQHEASAAKALEAAVAEYETKKEFFITNAKIISQEQEHAKILDESKEKINEISEKIKGWWRNLKAITSDPKIATGLWLAASLERIGEMVEGFLEFNHEIQSSITQAVDVAGAGLAMMPSMLAYGLGFSGTMKMSSALIKEFGNFSALNKENVQLTAKMSQKFGVSEDSAAKLVRMFSNIKDMTGVSAKHTEALFENMARAANVPIGAVMEDIASNSDFFATHMKGGGENMARAAIAAKQLGIDLGTVEKISSTILNVEQSIGSEMEAAVLTGRSFNLEQARMLAAQGDFNGMLKELLTQISPEELNRMNLWQREAVANMLGVSSAEMMNMVNSQEMLVEIGLKEASTWETILNYAVGYGEVIKDNAVWLASSVNMLISFSRVLVAMMPNITKLGGVGRFMGRLSGTTAPGEGPMPTISKGPTADITKGAMTSEKTISSSSKAVTGLGSQMGALIKGAAAAAILAGALWVVSKAVQNFMSVSWEDMAKAGVALGGLIVATVGMTAALNAIGATAASPLLWAGLAVMGALTLALMGVGSAMESIGRASVDFATSLSLIGQNLSTIAPAILLLGTAVPLMIGMGAGFAAMGMGLIPLALGLAAVAPFVGVLEAIANTGIFSDSTGSEKKKVTSEKGGEEKSVQEQIVEKLDKLIELFTKGADINLDGKKVGSWIGDTAKTSRAYSKG